MQERSNAPFLFVADSAMELIDAYNFRDDSIARPGFVLLYFGQPLWRKEEMKYLRLNTGTILGLIKNAQSNQIISTDKRTSDETSQ